MEELLKVLNSKELYNEIISHFKVDNYFEANMEKLQDVVIKTPAFQKSFVALNLSSESMSNYKTSLLTNINAQLVIDVLSTTFLFDPTTGHREGIKTNFLDAVVYWNKIPVFIPILTVGLDRVLVDKSRMYGAPVMPIEVQVHNCTSNMYSLAIETISDYLGMDDTTEEDPRLFSFNMTNDLVYSPLLPTIVRIAVSEERAVELQSDDWGYKMESLDDFSDNLIKGTSTTDDGEAVEGPFAKALGMALKYFLIDG